MFVLSDLTGHLDAGPSEIPAQFCGQHGRKPVLAASHQACKQVQRQQGRRQNVQVQALTTGAGGQKIKKVVLAYSGGLDTSVILKWLQETYDCEVVTFTADLGQVGSPASMSRLDKPAPTTYTISCMRWQLQGGGQASACSSAMLLHGSAILQCELSLQLQCQHTHCCPEVIFLQNGPAQVDHAHTG